MPKRCRRLGHSEAPTTRRQQPTIVSVERSRYPVLRFARMLFIIQPPSAALGSPLFAYPDIDPNRTALESERLTQPPLQAPPIAGLQETRGEQHESRRTGGGLGREQDACLLAAANRGWRRRHHLLDPRVQR